MKLRDKRLAKGICLRGTCYWVDVSIDGCRIRRAVGGTIEEARAVLAELRGQQRVSKRPRTTGPVVGALIDRYLERQRVRTRPKAQQTARAFCKRIRQHFGDRRVGPLAVEDLDAFGWKPRSRCGRPKLEAEIRALIRRMSRDNPTWGGRRIRSELHLLGYEVGELTVAKCMVRGGKPPLAPPASREARSQASRDSRMPKDLGRNDAIP